MDLAALLAGLGLGLSLIVAIGAQNVFVLRQGIRREHVALVVTICIASDALLIAAGVGGLGLVVAAAPWLVDAARWAGAAFLVGYGALAARRALRPSGEVLDVGAEPAARTAPAVAPALGAPPASADRPEPAPGTDAGAPPTTPAGRVATAARPAALGVALSCLALTWLNPHVYLDTVFLIGSIAASHGEARWVFGVGAMLASILWFTALGVGARGLGRVLRTTRAWRLLDGLVAVVMLAIAATLVLG